jgi:hypothetical protein
MAEISGVEKTLLKIWESVMAVILKSNANRVLTASEN